MSSYLWCLECENGYVLIFGNYDEKQARDLVNPAELGEVRSAELVSGPAVNAPLAGEYQFNYCPAED